MRPQWLPTQTGPLGISVRRRQSLLRRIVFWLLGSRP